MFYRCWIIDYRQPGSTMNLDWFSILLGFVLGVIVAGGAWFYVFTDRDYDSGHVP